MKRGPWHQFGDRSQNLVLEQLQRGNCVGVVLSPCNLNLENTIDRSTEYAALGAEIILDTQFFDPSFENTRSKTFEFSPFRQSVTDLCKIGDQDLSDLARRLETRNREVKATAVVAPAVAYQAGRLELVDLNAKLFSAAKSVGDSLGVPTYSTAFLSRSVIATDTLAEEALSYATSLDADGYYYAIELDEDERVPTDPDLVARIAGLGLTLACTGVPILHGYAGLTGLISLAVGADAVAFGHFHNLRYFSSARFEPKPEQPRTTPPPPRYMSGALWSTIVYPDETALLGDLWVKVRSESPFGPSQPNEIWDSWDANKHLLHVIAEELSAICLSRSALKCAQTAAAKLRAAADLHQRISAKGIVVKDNANAHQGVWAEAITKLINQRATDYEYLSMLGK